MILFLLLAALPLTAAQYTIASPDGLIAVTLTEREGGLFFRATHRGRGFVFDSRLGLDGIDPDWRKARAEERRVRTSWKPLYGERSTIPDRYNSLALRTPQLSVVFRVYDEGIAFRYELGRQRPARIDGELTTFHFPNGTLAWEEYGTEGEYARVPYDDIKPKCERPLTLEIPGGFFASLLEAAQTDWPRMLLAPSDDGAIEIYREGPIDLAETAVSPWRVLLVGDRPGQLLERNYLLLNLNPPSALPDVSWIRPGKVIREVTLSTEGGKRAVDFCVRQGLQFVEYDAGWYGHEYDDKSDATQVSPDPDRIKNIPGHGGLDLQEVIRYARERGIGVILYVNRRALERQMDTIFPLYRQWGVAGVKFGFVQVEGQKWARWLRQAVAKAAAHGLMVDVHDSYRPSGMTRTWPNLMTQEGVRGNEHMPTARHNATLPFTRALAGASDYTICWTTPRLKTTRGHQMAQSVIHYSPWQFLFWYDRPEQIEASPQLDWFRQLPTVWDETRVLDGAIGEKAVIARRRGRDWFLGAITNEEPRRLEIPLPFAGRPMRAELYCDGPVRELDLPASATLTLDLPASGGCAAILRPVAARK
jgi:alpha-glucosidase